MAETDNPLPASAKESIVHSSGREDAPDLRFVHFNDVYHIDASSRDPVGGIARFQTLCDHYRSHSQFRGLPELITLFSGDVFNPSLESSITKGSHMVPVLNHLRVDCACVGNHDLDFGVPQFERLAEKCDFPWLIANVIDPALGEDVPLGHAKKTTILTASNGIKIGVIGLVEREWLATINSLPPNLTYHSASETAKELAPELRRQGADMVVALTHQREPNDHKLAEKTPEGLLDLILGGHDHFYGHQIVNGAHVLRSGTDFKNISYIKAWRRQASPQRWDFEICRRDVLQDIPEQPAAAELVEKISSGLRAKLEKPIGYTAAPLDARFTTVRLKESNLANFVCDLMRLYYGADCTIMAGGTVRGDQVYPPGLLRAKDLMDCFPFEDPVVVVRLNGQAIWDALENGVSTYPALEGRFPQVSNIRFRFDPSRPPGNRIDFVEIGGHQLDPSKAYVLATRDYMTRGKDGFTSLLYKSLGGTAEEIVSDENGILISMLLRQYFMSLRLFGLWSASNPLHPDSNAALAAAPKQHDSLTAHFTTQVHDKLHSSHPVKSPAPSAATTPMPAPDPFASAAVAIETSPHPQADQPSDDEDEEHADPLGGKDTHAALHAVADARDAQGRRAATMRRVLRKWARIAGLADRLHLPDEQGEGEFVVGVDGAPPSGRAWMRWTRAVAPRLEGRIICVRSA